MAIPSAYTNETFKAYMIARVASIAGVLGLKPASFDEAMNDALIAYGVADASLASDMNKLRAIGQIYAWRLIVDESVGEYQFSADGGSYNRQQIHDHAVKILAALELQYADLLPVPASANVSHAIKVGSVIHADSYDWAE